MSAPVKMMNRPPAAILPKKPARRATLPNDCPIMVSQATALGMFFVVICASVPLIPLGPNSAVLDPPEEFLHAIREHDDSRDDSQEGVNIGRIGLHECADHSESE